MGLKILMDRLERDGFWDKVQIVLFIGSIIAAIVMLSTRNDGKGDVRQETNTQYENKEKG